MKFIALVVALVIEQARPLRRENRIYRWFGDYAALIERHFNGGQYDHGIIGWLLALAPFVAAAFVIHVLLGTIGLGWLWSIAVLYLTMGFRQFSRHFSEIILALRENRVEAARVELAQWRGEPVVELGSGEIAKISIEQGLIGAQRHVFGPIAWFVVFGPAGAVAYRIAAMLAEQWGARTDAEFGEFGRFASRAFHWIDWIPVRAAAASFAIVGNFEDAIYCWRTQARGWFDEAEGIILAAGAGAIGARLGDSLHQAGTVHFRPEMGIGEPPDVELMQSAVGLVWRALVLWLFLLLLLSIAYALG